MGKKLADDAFTRVFFSLLLESRMLLAFEMLAGIDESLGRFTQMHVNLYELARKVLQMM